MQHVITDGCISYGILYMCQYVLKVASELISSRTVATLAFAA